MLAIKSVVDTIEQEDLRCFKRLLLQQTTD